MNPNSSAAAAQDTDTAMELLSYNVVVKRAQHRLSQAELAKHARVARQTVSKIESGYGNVRVDILERIARALACDVAELFTPLMRNPDDAEMLRRASAPISEFVEADAYFAASDEARANRYSAAGRPRKLDRRSPSKRS